MKLSDAQRRNLVVLGEKDGGRGVLPGQFGTRSNTLESLARLGLARSGMEHGVLRWRYWITEAGREKLRAG